MKQTFSFCIVGFDPPGSIKQKTIKQCALLVAQACLHDQSSKLDLVSGVFLSGLGNCHLDHTFSLLKPAPEFRQGGAS